MILIHTDDFQHQTILSDIIQSSILLSSLILHEAPQTTKRTNRKQQKSKRTLLKWIQERQPLKNKTKKKGSEKVHLSGSAQRKTLSKIKIKILHTCLPQNIQTF